MHAYALHLPYTWYLRHLDSTTMVKAEKAFEMARHIMRKEGIPAGMSSGAAMCAALEIAQSMTSGNIVAILSDGGEEHLSTELFHS